MAPITRGQSLRRMRGVDQRIVTRVGFAVNHRLHFAVDGDEGVTEAIELGEGFTLRGFDHKRARDRPAHGWGVKAIIDQPLGGVLDFDAVSLPGPEIDDALMRYQILVAAIEHGEERLEAFGDVVGVEDGDPGGLGESTRAHHADIHPGNN